MQVVFCFLTCCCCCCAAAVVAAAGSSGEWDSSVPEEGRALLDEKGLIPVPFATRVVSSLIAMLQGVEVLCNLAILYLFKDDFRIDPALLAVVLGALRLPWTVKPLWALAADNFPLFGYRRKSYIFLGASMCIVATLGIGLGGYKSLYATTLLLLLYFWGSAICNVIGEALVVEAGRRDVNEEATARTVSVFFAFRKLSFATVSYLSGLLLAVMAKQYVFVVAAALPAAVLFATFALEEPQIQTVLPPKQQFKELWKVLKQPVLLNSTLFIFVMMVNLPAIHAPADAAAVDAAANAAAADADADLVAADAARNAADEAAAGGAAAAGDAV